MDKELDAFIDNPHVVPEHSPADYIDVGELDFNNPDSAHYVEFGDSPGMVRKLGEFYFKDSTQEEFYTICKRLTSLRARDRLEVSGVPRATIVIATIEDLVTLRYTIRQLSLQDGIEQAEIILYGNMPASFSDEQKQKQQAILDAVVEEFPRLRMRSVNEEYDWSMSADRPLMGRLRRDYMDVIALDAIERQFGVDHPIITLDADTKLITQGSIISLADAISHPKSTIALAHLETRFLLDSQEAPLTDARKLAALQEIRRRQWIRTKTNEGIERYGDYGVRMPYDEEWGAAIALGAYLTVGGYNGHGFINENRDLKTRMIRARDEVTAVMKHAKPEIEGDMSYYAHYLPGKVVRSSARRQEDLFNSWMQEPIEADRELGYKRRTESYISNGLPYEAFSHTDSVRTENGDIAPPRDMDRLCRMVGAILFCDSVISYPNALPLPDPSALLRRLDLPDPRD